MCLHTGFIHRFILCDERRACIQATAGKSDVLLSQGISVSTLLGAANSGSLSHTYCWGKGTLEVLLESWPTSSIDPDIPLSCQDDRVSMELSLSSCAEIGVPLDLRQVSQGISGVA